MLAFLLRLLGLQLETAQNDPPLRGILSGDGKLKIYTGRKRYTLSRIRGKDPGGE